MTDDERDPLGGVERSRRDFIKKLAILGFAAPVLNSFGMSAIAGASSRGSKNPPKQSHPNQSFPNQSEPPCDPPKPPPKPPTPPKPPPKPPAPPKKPGRR